MKTKDLIAGLALIGLGFIFLADNLDYIELDFSAVWPLLVLLAGISFGIGYLKNKKNYGLLMPATIFIVMGFVFWYCTVTGWDAMYTLWPFFLIGPGLGFYLMYILGEREKGLLIPAGILAGLGLLFLFRYSRVLKYWSVILIGIGVYMIYKHFKTENRDGL
jgi:hypothetical protein